MTDDEEHANYVRRVRRHGKDKDFTELGYNSKMFVFNADVIEYRMSKMEEWQKRRNDIAWLYTSELDNVICQPVSQGLQHNFHKYVIRFEDKAERKRVKDSLKLIGLNASIHYEKPLSKNSLYSDITYKTDTCTNSQHAADTVMSLPVHAWLTDEEVNKICNMILMTV